MLMLLYRSEYVTIVSIMVCMTAWDFVIGVLFGIVVSCKHCPRIPREARMLIGFLILKASFSWFKTLNCEVYVLYIRAIRPCQLYADQVCNGRIYEKFPNRQPYYVCMVCRNSTSCFVTCSPFTNRIFIFWNDYSCRRIHSRSYRRTVLAK